jgi:hypothetical protein
VAKCRFTVATFGRHWSVSLPAAKFIRKIKRTPKYQHILYFAKITREKGDGLLIALKITIIF